MRKSNGHRAARTEWLGEDRKVYAGRWWYRAEGFFVHPKSGLLCFAPRQSARQRKKERLLRQEIDEVRLDRCRSYKLIDGQWYIVAYEYVPAERGESHIRWDVVERRQVKLTWGTHRLAVSKRQCNREEVQWIRRRIAAWQKEVHRM